MAILSFLLLLVHGTVHCTCMLLHLVSFEEMDESSEMSSRSFCIRQQQKLRLDNLTAINKTGRLLYFLVLKNRLAFV